MCQNVEKNLLAIATPALNSITAVLKVVAPNDPNLAKYEADVTTLLGQLATFTTSGGTAATIVEIINDVIADVQLIPVPIEDQLLIDIGLDGLESVISAIGLNSTTGGVTAAAVAKAMPVKADPVYYGKFAAIEYTRDWNSAIKARPNLKAAAGTMIDNRRMMLAQLLD